VDDFFNNSHKSIDLHESTKNQKASLVLTFGLGLAFRESGIQISHLVL
jgi:hypothetical protein